MYLVKPAARDAVETDPRFDTYDDAQEAAGPGDEIIYNNLPCFILSGLRSDDTIVNLVHWHHEPSQDDIDEMAQTVQGEYVCLYLSQMKSVHTPCLSS